MPANPRILYFYPHPSGFIQKDIDLLSAEYTVASMAFAAGSKWSVPFRLLYQFAFLLLRLPFATCVVCRFAGWHSLLPVFLARLFRKPVLVIVGGTEAHYFPSIRYGNSSRKAYGWATGTSLRFATRIAPVDESLVNHDYRYDASFPSKQGLLNIYPGLRTPITVIHNGYDANVHAAMRGIQREANSFLTVANAGTRTEFILKGIDLLLEAARQCPHFSFTVAGRRPDWIRTEEYPNVKFTGPVALKGLLELFSSHAFYLQLSVAEGFPNALCEAMLCGCIPIGSDVFSIPMIIAQTGFIVKSRNVNQVVDALNAATHSDVAALSKAASDRIAREYPLSKRAEKLLGALREIRGGF